MGTWGSGIFDNDNAMDSIGGLVEVKPKPDFAHRIVHQALALWFDRSDGTAFMKGLQKDRVELTRLPKPLFETLVALTQNPKMTFGRHSRSAAVTKITGSYGDGWRIDGVFDIPGAMEVVRSVAARNATPRSCAAGNRPL